MGSRNRKVSHAFLGLLPYWYDSPKDKLDSSFMYEWEIFRLQLEAMKAPDPSSSIVSDVEEYCRLDQLRLF